MSFTVVPESILGYACQVNHAQSDTHEARRFVAGHSEFGGGVGPLWIIARSAHTQGVGAVLAVLDRAASILDVSHHELTGAAEYYRRADLAAAKRADGALPAPRRGGDSSLAQAWESNQCPPSFGDSREPTRHLRPVMDVEYSHPLGWMDNLSLSHWALEACKAVLGLNPLEKVLGYFSGDWQALAKAGGAIGRVGDAMQDVGYNVQGGAIALGRDWAGNAADAAYAYFTDLADRTARLREPLTEMSKQYDRIAYAVWNAVEGMSGILKGLIDAAIIAGVAFAAGTLFIETGVGAVVGYGTAALEVVEMLRLWGLATSLMQTTYSLVQMAAGAIVTAATGLGTADLPTLPCGAGYDHALVPA